MAEMKISIAAPELIAAINTLTEALAGTPAPIVEQPSAPQQDTTQAPAPQQAYIAPAPIVAQPPVPTAAPTAVPVAQAPSYTLEQVARAGASLVDAGKMEPLLALLSKYGVAAVTQLKPDMYGAFATELRALGAQI